MQFKLFKSELIRLLRSKWILLIFVYSILLILLQIFSVNDYSTSKVFNDSAFLRIIGFDFSGMGTNLFVMIFPFTAALVGASLYAEDNSSNFLPFTVARTAPKIFTVTSACASFVAGGVAANLPYLLESWFYFMQYPTTAMDRFSVWLPISAEFWGYQLFTSQPLILWAIYVFIFFMFGGFYALLGHVVSYFARTKYLETIVPFLLHIALWLILSLLDYVEFSPMILLSPVQSSSFAASGFPNGIALLVLFVLFFVPLTILVWRKAHEEVF